MKTIIAFLFVVGPFAVNAQEQVKEVKAVNTSTVSVKTLENAPNKTHTKKQVSTSNATMQKGTKEAVKTEETQPLTDRKN